MSGGYNYVLGVSVWRGGGYVLEPLRIDTGDKA